MARSRVIPNLLYGTLGVAVAATATYYAVRTLRRRRAGRNADEKMLSLRRSTREAGRAAKDTAQKVGRDLREGGEDTIEAFESTTVKGL